MTTTIALAGKGGVGKTTVSALVIRYLVTKHAGAVLAIDADPSTNLNMALGMDIECTVGEIREGMLSQVKDSLLAGGAAYGALPGGVSKRDYLDYQVRSSLSEGDACDLIAMGRSEGPGCYCAVNHNLREVVDALSRNYAYVVIDNEAGMEHLSRRTTRDVQYLWIVTDPSQRGLAAAERIASFRNEMDIHIESAGLILNRVQGEVHPAVLEKIARIGIPLLAILPDSRTIADLDSTGLPLVNIEKESDVYQAIVEMMQQLKI